MTKGYRFTTLCLLTAVTAGCDLGNYPDLREPLDPFIGIDGSDQVTFLHADETGSTFLVLSGPSVDERRFTRTEMPIDGGGVRLTTGPYRIDDDQITFEGELRFFREPNGIDFGDRDGSTREAISESETFDFVDDNGRLTLSSSGGDVSSFVDLDRVLASAGELGALSLIRLFNASVLSAQARVVGFGTAAMLEYTTPGVFGATLNGTVTVELRDLLRPKTSFDYDNFSDFSGLTLDGVQTSDTSFSGEGFSFGVVRMVVRRRADPTAVLVVDIDYGESDGSAGLIIDGGEAAGGFYEVTVDGETTRIPWEQLEFRDLRALLDVVELPPTIEE